MKSGDVKQFRAALNGGALLLEGIGPGKPALLILSSCIGKAVPRVAAPSRLARPDGENPALTSECQIKRMKRSVACDHHEGIRVNPYIQFSKDVFGTI